MVLHILRGNLYLSLEGERVNCGVYDFTRKSYLRAMNCSLRKIKYLGSENYNLGRIRYLEFEN